MSERRAEVRLATWEDAMSICDTLLRAHAEAETPFPEPELPYAVQYMMDLANQGLVVVAVHGTRIVGCIVLDHTHWPWNRNARLLVNSHFWIERPYRSGGIARRLLTEAKRVADQLALPLLIEMSSGGEDTALKDRFVAMQGFKPVGGKFYRAQRGDRDGRNSTD